VRTTLLLVLHQEKQLLQVAPIQALAIQRLTPTPLAQAMWQWGIKLSTPTLQPATVPLLAIKLGTAIL
jgi:hypothetical protein